MSFAFNRGVGSKKIVEHKNNTKMGFWGHIKQQLTNLMSFAFNRGVGSDFFLYLGPQTKKLGGGQQITKAQNIF